MSGLKSLSYRSNLTYPPTVTTTSDEMTRVPTIREWNLRNLASVGNR